MAIVLTSGIVPKNVKGKVGDVVFAKLNKETTIRAYQPKVRNPRTPAQVRQRRKFSALQHGITQIYGLGFKPYGIKLKGHTAYTSISRMIHNNWVVKSVGYAHGYLPSVPKDFQRLVACDTNLDNELFKYIAVRVMKPTGSNNAAVYLGVSLPKNIFPEVATGLASVMYFGSNIAFSNMYSYVAIMGINFAKVSVFDSNDLHMAINESGVYEQKILGTSADAISMNYKYVYKANINTIQDPKIEDNIFMWFGATERTLDFFNASSFDDISVDSYWPGVESSKKAGATAFVFSTGVETENIGTEGLIDESTSVYARRCLIAVNDWSDLYTIGD